MSNLRLGKIGVIFTGCLVAAGGFASSASADRIDYQVTQFGHDRSFYTESDDAKSLELTGTVLTINNDLGLDLTDPNSREALGEILTGAGLEHFQMIFDRFATHWSVQLLPTTDGRMDWLLGDEPLTRAEPHRPLVSSPASVREGTGGSGATPPEPAGLPEFTSLAVPEPTTVAALGLGAIWLTRRRAMH